MRSTTLTLAALSIAAVARPLPEEPGFVELNGAGLAIEYSASEDEAVVVVTADSNASLLGIEVRNPTGRAMLQLISANARSGTLSGVRVETGKSSLADLLAAWPEGPYVLRSRTWEGAPAGATAWLSHTLPAVPEMTSPLEGAVVDGDALTVTWVPDPSAASYHVVLEQDDNDGLVADLPARSGSFQVPPGILRPGAETHVEVAIVGLDGNCTVVERSFTTR